MPDACAKTLISFNLLFGFAADPAIVQVVMALMLLQGEMLTLGVANIVRGSTSDSIIDAWSWPDFVCCLVALAVGELITIGLLAIRARGMKGTVVFAALSIMMLSGTVYLGTTGCSDYQNQWTAQAIAVLIVESLVLSWVNAALAKRIRNQQEARSRFSAIEKVAE